MDELSMTPEAGASPTALGSDMQRLDDRIAGDLVWPGHPEYDQARRLWNGLIDKRPMAIVRCAADADVVEALRFAREHDLEVSVRGGGHNVAGKALCEGGVVIDLSRMKRVSVDPVARTVTVQGGAKLGDVDGHTHRHNLAVPYGVISDTGVAGLTLHGGYGWLARRHGLAIDNLLEATVVTADGQILRASDAENPDLFWALRGGGGNFGAVTSFKFRAYPVGPQVWFGLVIYPLDQADQVTRGFCDYLQGASEDLLGILLHWSAPPVPEVPQHLHGAPVTIVAACYSGPLEKGEEVLRPLRTLAQPIADLTTQRSFSEVQRAFDEDYPTGRLYYWKSAFLDDLPDAVLDQMKDLASRRPSPLNTVELWPLGGAVGRVSPTATAFAHRSSRFLVGIEANWDEPERTSENISWAREVYSALEPFSGGRAYLNFGGFGEGGDGFVRAAYGPNYARLQQVKKQYDPDNVFRGNFNIAPAP